LSILHHRYAQIYSDFALIIV